MVYRKPHLDCSENNCQSYSAYIKVQKKWVTTGDYNSRCRIFTTENNVRTFDEIQQKEHDKWLQDKLPFLKKKWLDYNQGVDTSNDSFRHI